jgi:hypothetical protein
VTIRTSPAKRIAFVTNTRNRKAVFAPEGEMVDFAEFTVGETDKWLRVEVMDDGGRYAFTRGYNRRELELE